MYSKYQRKKALQLYDKCKSVTKVIQTLGYPTRKCLYDWISERDSPPKEKALRKRFHNTPEHPRHPPIEVKLQTIHRCFELGESVQLVSEEIGYSRAKYNSYKGEITPAVPNIIERDFRADAPNKKWLTDITEFAIPTGKVYLSPIVDCFDGMLSAWKISTVPDANLVNSMLDDAIASLKEEEHPLVHTDRGCHYR